MDGLIAFLQQNVWFIGPPLLLLAVVGWVFRPSARARYRRDSRIPFDD